MGDFNENYHPGRRATDRLRNPREYYYEHEILALLSKEDKEQAAALLRQYMKSAVPMQPLPPQIKPEEKTQAAPQSNGDVTPDTQVKLKLSVLLAVFVAVAGWGSTYMEKSTKETEKKVIIDRILTETGDKINGVRESIKALGVEQDELKGLVNSYSEEASTITISQRQLFKEIEKLSKQVERIEREQYRSRDTWQKRD